jgi:hypothetical protein
MAAALAAAAAAAGGGAREEEIEGEWHEMVLLPREILREPPSRKLGVAAAEELRHRIFGCELIQEAGILLRQPQVVMATAQNLFHRFFYRRALTSADALQQQGEGEEGDDAEQKGRKCVFLFDAFTVAMGALFLASKLEELPKAPRDLIFIFHAMMRRRRGLPPSLLEVTSTVRSFFALFALFDRSIVCSFIRSYLEHWPFRSHSHKRSRTHPPTHTHSLPKPKHNTHSGTTTCARRC